MMFLTISKVINLTIMNITKKTIYYTIIGFTLIICMASNFSPELSYSEDKSSNPYIMENSNALENNLENNKEYYSEKNGSSVEEDFNFVAVGDFSCNEDA